AAFSAAVRLRPDFSKNVIAASSSKEGEFATSTTTFAPASASVKPSPVTVLTPELGDAATTSCPLLRSRAVSFVPMSPLPPIITIFIAISSWISISRDDIDAGARMTPSDAMQKAPEPGGSPCGNFESSWDLASKFVPNEKRDIQGRAPIGPAPGLRAAAKERGAGATGGEPSAPTRSRPSDLQS